MGREQWLVTSGQWLVNWASHMRQRVGTQSSKTAATVEDSDHFRSNIYDDTMVRRGKGAR